MKKIKAISLLTLPLIVVGTGVAVSKISDNNQDISVQKQVKSTNDIINNGYIKDLALGNTHSGAIITDSLGNDYLYTWGNNSDGQLGNGTVGGQAVTPQEIKFFPEGTKLKNLEMGNNTSAIVVTDDKNNDYLYVWGENASAQLGINSSTDKNTPTKVTYLPTNSQIKNLSLGEGKHGGAVVTDSLGNDNLYMWGSNDKGQGGAGGSSTYWTPTKVTSLPAYNEIKDFDLGEQHSGVVIEDTTGKDRIFTWGRNSEGQLGTGNTTQKSQPIEITNYLPYNSTIKDMDLGTAFSAVITTDTSGNDHLFTWGNNAIGQLGLGTSVEIIKTPTEVTGLPSSHEFKSLNMRASGSSIVTTDSSGEDHVFTWGHNNWGQLGYASSDDSKPYIYSPREVEFPIEGDLVSFQTSYDDSAMIIRDEVGQEHLYMWGNNAYGKFGNGTISEADHNTPNEVDILDNVESITTTFIERTSDTKFTFELSVPEEMEFDSSLVSIYNSNGIEVGEANLTEEATKSSGTYTYKSEITDLDNSLNDKVYWSVDGGNSLNLISSESFTIPDNNSNAIIYSSIGIAGIILLILIIVVVVLLLSKDSNKEEDQSQNLYGEDKKSKKQGKAKKAKEEEQRNKQNDVLDAF